MMRECLVWDRVTGFDDTAADLARDLDLAVFRTAERLAALGFDLGLFMESSEVCATPYAAPPQPRPGNVTRQGGPRSAPLPPQVTTATLRSSPKASQF
jgi:hypothetical protein